MTRRHDTPGAVNKRELPDNVGESDLYYNVEDRPPIGVTLFFGFQLALANICYCIMMAVLIQDFICADKNFATKMFSSITFMSGVTTIIQSYFGVRVPVFQGPAVVWFLPYMNARTDPRWGCQDNNDTSMLSTSMNGTNVTDALGDTHPGWGTEWAKVAGSLMAAEGLQMFLAATGIVSQVGRLFRPITICVFFILLGFYLHGLISSFSEVHWGISAMSVAIIVFFAQYIHWIKFPLPTWTPKKGLAVTKMPLFELFPVVFAVLLCWAIVAIITVAGGFPDDENDIRYQSRTDIHSHAIADAPVFIFPHPGQFISEIDFSIEYFIMFLVPVMATVLESMGDYCQFALTCCLPRPPAHAMNRGIFMEGLCGYFSALMGMGLALTSYSQIVGIIRLTKVGSRQVYGMAGIILMFLAVFGKVGAVFVSIPKPVLAGPVFIGIAMLVGATFMNLKGVDLGQARNQTTLGCALMVGVFVPLYFESHKDAINTGSVMADRIIVSFMTTHFLMGGFVAAFLDNTLPGRSNDEKKMLERMSIDMEGTSEHVQNATPESGETTMKKQGKRLRTYDEMMKIYEPPFISKYTRRWKCTKFVPMLPDPYPDLEDDEETGKTSTNL